MVCPNCQKENPTEAKFCIKCGTGLNVPLKVQQDSATKVELEQPKNLCMVCKKPLLQDSTNKVCAKCKEIQLVKTEREYMRTFVGDKADYYLSKWDTLQKKTSWWKSNNTGNWSTILCGPYWYAYRKMYGMAALIMLIIYLFDMFFYDIVKGSSFEGTFRAFYLPLSIAFASAANPLYLKFTKRKIAKLKSTYSNEIELKHEITKAGGTSWASAIVLVMLTLIVVITPIVMDGYKQRAKEAELATYNQLFTAAVQEESEALEKLNAILTDQSTIGVTIAQTIDSQIVPIYKNIKSKLEAINPPEIGTAKEFHSLAVAQINAKCNALIKMSQAANADNVADFKIAIDDFKASESRLREYAAKMKAQEGKTK